MKFWVEENVMRFEETRRRYSTKAQREVEIMGCRARVEFSLVSMSVIITGPRPCLCYPLPHELPLLTNFMATFSDLRTRCVQWRDNGASTFARKVLNHPSNIYCFFRPLFNGLNGKGLVCEE